VGNTGGRSRRARRRCYPTCDAQPPTAASTGGRGTFTLIEPPRRLAFTWGWDNDPSATQLVELEFIDHGQRTTVVMTYTGLPEAETDEYRDGWQNAFDNLGPRTGRMRAGTSRVGWARRVGAALLLYSMDLTVTASGAAACC
jgi:hypothetical protein